MENKSIDLKDILRPIKCKKCRCRLVYKALGEYICEGCGEIELDEYGKIRTYLEKNGPQPAVVIAGETKVPVGVIDQYLREGKLEIPDGSPLYIQCEKCNTEIRYGRFCPACAAQLSKGLESVLVSTDVGEIPKTKSKEPAKMHYFSK